MKDEYKYTSTCMYLDKSMEQCTWYLHREQHVQLYFNSMYFLCAKHNNG